MFDKEHARGVLAVRRSMTQPDRGAEAFSAFTISAIFFSGSWVLAHHALAQTSQSLLRIELFVAAAACALVGLFFALAFYVRFLDWKRSRDRDKEAQHAQSR